MIKEKTGTILLVDDNHHNLQVLCQNLRDIDADLRIAKCGLDALHVIKESKPDLVLLDINMPDMDGYEVCRRIKEDALTESISIIFISALGELPNKIKGFNLGAVDYISKPFKSEELIARVQSHLKINQQQEVLKSENMSLQIEAKKIEANTLDAKFKTVVPLLGSSDVAQELRRKIKVVGSNTFPVLIYSQPRCGESLIAKMIHEISELNHLPFIYINCAHLNLNNIHQIFSVSNTNDDFFNGGTLFLDRINDLDLTLQDAFLANYNDLKNILSTTENHQLRLLSCATENLSIKCKKLQFSPDLYDTLNAGHVLSCPALYERQADIRDFVNFYMTQAATRFGKNVKTIDCETLVMLEKYTWANLREIKNMVERHVALSLTDQLVIPKNSLKHGISISGYRLTKSLGIGGMGEVWEASHDFLPRKAAIKLIKAPYAESDLMCEKRFHREVHANSSLCSPHTVRIYDFGVCEDGALYYVMELLKGENLNTLIEQCGKIPLARSIFILKQICLSLTEAHFHGIVHRDIKPDNILVCAMPPHYDFVKVLDFGITKELNYNKDDNLTGEKILGTPAFLAPEFISDNGPVGVKADVYSFACLAYYMLVGKKLFDNENLMKCLASHIHDAPPSISAFGNFKKFPGSLEAVLLQCLSKDPLQRPNIHEVFECLVSLEDSFPWKHKEARMWWNENKACISHECMM
jgi:DNA-binding NtrC family response regulator